MVPIANIDDFYQYGPSLNIVAPAKARVQFQQWIPAFAGMTTTVEFKGQVNKLDEDHQYQ